MTKRSRRKFGAEFKAKVVLEALSERSTLEELARKYELHPNQISIWKKEAVSRMSTVFGSDQSGSVASNEERIQQLYAQIGQLKVENDFLKKRL